jgi:hypothetical protein
MSSAIAKEKAEKKLTQLGNRFADSVVGLRNETLQNVGFVGFRYGSIQPTNILNRAVLSTLWRKFAYL